MTAFPELLQPSWYSCAGRLAYYMSHSKFTGNKPTNQSITAKVATYAARFFVAVPLLIVATTLDVSRNLLLLSLIPLAIPLSLMAGKKLSCCFYYYRAVFVDILVGTVLPLMAIGFALRGKIIPSNRIDNFVLCNRFSVLQPDSELMDAVIKKKDYYTFRKLLKKFPAAQFQTIVCRNAEKRILQCSHPLDPQTGHFLDPRIRNEKFCDDVHRVYGPIIKTSTLSLSLPEQLLARDSFQSLLTLIKFGYEINVPQLLVFKWMVTEMIAGSKTTFASDSLDYLDLRKCDDHFASKTFCGDTYSIRKKKQEEEACNNNPYYLGLILAGGWGTSLRRVDDDSIYVRRYSYIYVPILQKMGEYNTKECLEKIHRLYESRFTGEVLDSRYAPIRELIIAYLIGSCPPKNSNSNINEFEIKELEESVAVEEG